MFACVVVCLVLWQIDLGDIRGRTASSIDQASPPSERMRQAFEYMKANVPYDYIERDIYFLAPPLRPLRSTARQVLDNGGTCADRSRALVVILGQYGLSTVPRK